MNAATKTETTLASAMAAAFGEIEAATKSNENAAFKQGGKASKYADIGAVIAAIKPALISHGLFFTQRPEPSEGGVTVETVLTHSSGESMSLGRLYVPANKNDPQGFGSALTYARRYALVTAFGVPVEDDDGNAAANQAPARQREPLAVTAAKTAITSAVDRVELKRWKAANEAMLAELPTEEADEIVRAYTFRWNGFAPVAKPATTEEAATFRKAGSSSLPRSNGHAPSAAELISADEIPF